MMITLQEIMTIDTDINKLFLLLYKGNILNIFAQNLQ